MWNLAVIPYQNKPTGNTTYIKDKDIHSTALTLFDPCKELFSKCYTTQKMKFPIKYFFSKCDQIRRFLRISSHLLKKSLTVKFIFCAELRERHCEIKIQLKIEMQVCK